MDRILIDVQELTDVVAGDDVKSAILRRELRGLVDELNSVLPDYQVGLLYLDTGEYLWLVKVDPTEGSYWHDLEETRREQLLAIEALDDVQLTRIDDE